MKTTVKLMLATTLIACAVAFAVSAPVIQATEDFVTNETAKVEAKIGIASNNVVRIFREETHVVKTNVISMINRIPDKPLGVVWEGIMVNGQLYYVATMPLPEEPEEE